MYHIKINKEQQGNSTTIEGCFWKLEYKPFFFFWTVKIEILLIIGLEKKPHKVYKNREKLITDPSFGIWVTNHTKVKGNYYNKNWSCKVPQFLSMVQPNVYSIARNLVQGMQPPEGCPLAGIVFPQSRTCSWRSKWTKPLLPKSPFPPL